MQHCAVWLVCVYAICIPTSVTFELCRLLGFLLCYSWLFFTLVGINYSVCHLFINKIFTMFYFWHSYMINVGMAFILLFLNLILAMQKVCYYQNNLSHLFQQVCYDCSRFLMLKWIWYWWLTTYKIKKTVKPNFIQLNKNIHIYMAHKLF